MVMGDPQSAELAQETIEARVIYKIETIYVMDDIPFRKQRKSLAKKLAALSCAATATMNKGSKG